MKIGLVLSGGGARGAYQAGVIRALSSHGIQVSAIAGASIGSLNGAIVASSPDLTVAAARLADVWNHVAKYSPLKFELSIYPKYLALLAAAGLTGPGRAGLMLISALAAKMGWDNVHTEEALLKDEPLSDIIDKYLEPEALAKGIPFYVSLHPHTTRLGALISFFLGEGLGRFDTAESVFLRVQDLPLEEQFQALLASAAIPVLFRPKEVQGAMFSDGGQGNYRKAQGNTPITPFIGLGFDLIIVTHLSDGSFWNIENFRGENILEIRPEMAISDNSIGDMLGFNEENIIRWMEQGYSDTERYLKDILSIGGARNAMSTTSRVVSEQLKKPIENHDLENAMARLKHRKLQ